MTARKKLITEQIDGKKDSDRIKSVENDFNSLGFGFGFHLLLVRVSH